MNDTFKYDPEDIESLLLHKQFNELYPEEKEFVLRHVEGEEEYDSLRTTLFLMHDTANNDDWLEPDPAIKANLLREFAGEDKKGFFIWLNSLFAMPAMPEIVWYRRPAVRYAFASLVLLLGVSSALVLFNTNQQAKEIAQTKQDANKENSTVPEAENTTDSTVSLLDKPTYAENHMPEVFPPAPAAVTETTMDEIKYTPMENDVNTINVYDNSSSIDDAPAAAIENEKEDLAATPKAKLSEEKKMENANDEVRSSDSQLFKDNENLNETVITGSATKGTATNTPDRNAVTLANISSNEVAMKKTQLKPMSANAAQMKDVLNLLYTAK